MLSLMCSSFGAGVLGRNNADSKPYRRGVVMTTAHSLGAITSVSKATSKNGAPLILINDTIADVKFHELMLKGRATCNSGSPDNISWTEMY